jgi:hypothetical protein
MKIMKIKKKTLKKPENQEAEGKKIYELIQILRN